MLGHPVGGLGGADVIGDISAGDLRGGLGVRHRDGRLHLDRIGGTRHRATGRFVDFICRRGAFVCRNAQRDHLRRRGGQRRNRVAGRGARRLDDRRSAEGLGDGPGNGDQQGLDQPATERIVAEGQQTRIEGPRNIGVAVEDCRCQLRRNVDRSGDRFDQPTARHGPDDVLHRFAETVDGTDHRTQRTRQQR